MKPKSRTMHLVLLQRIPQGLLWLESRKENEALRILGAGLEPLDDLESDESRGEPESDAFKNALKAIHAQLKRGWITHRNIVVITPSHRLTTRYLDTPPVEEETLGDLVGFEVSEALQVPLHDIAWDMLLSSHHGEKASRKLLWIASRRDYIDSLLNEWPDDLLQPTQLTPDFWGYYEYLLATDPGRLQEPALLVSREGDRATITIADRTAVYLTRSVPLKRPARLNDELVGTEAEEYALAMEIERTLYYAADRSTPNGPKSMICCGLEDWKMERLQMVADGNALILSRLTLDKVRSSFSLFPDSIRVEHLPLLCIAFCHLQLGITGPNLLEIEEEPVDWRSFIPEAALPSRKFLSIGGGLLVLFLALWIGKTAWFNHAVATRIDRGEGLIQLSNRLQREETALRQLTRTSVNYGEMFLFLAETLPEGILVKNFGVDAQTGIELSFTGGNNQQAVDLQKKLNEGPYFRDLVLERSVVEKEGFTIYMKGKMKPSR